MVKKFNSAPKDNTPPLRFEVWHFTDLGRNSEDNDALAQAFIRTKLQSWKVRKVRPVTSPENSNDRYTPIEVDFHYCHSSSSPDESFRVLWGRTIPSVIRAFFSTRSEPYNMTLYPLGDNLDLNVRKGFTRTTIQRSMAVEYATQSQLVSPDVDDTVLVELLRIGGTILRPGAAVADICIDAKRMLADMWHEGDSMTNLVDRAKEKLLESGILERLEAHYGTDGQELSPILTNEMTSAWQNAAVSFNFFGSLASDMKDILGDLSHKIKSSQPIAVSDEQLHTWILNMNAATVCFGEFQKTVDGLNQMIRASYNKDRNSSSKLQGFGVILIIFGILCATSGLAVGGVVAVGGATVLTDQMGKKKKIRAKTGNVKEFEGLIGKLGDALKDAKLALTAVYCSQVLKMPLELMARNQQKIILKALGVDVEKLQTPEYDEELVAMRMDRFCKVYKSLEKARGAVADDLCVQDRRLGSRRR